MPRNNSYQHYNNYINSNSYKKFGVGGMVNKGVEKGFGLFGLEDTAAENMVSGAAGAVAGYFTGDYGAIAQGAGDFTQGTGQIVDDVAGRETKYGEVAGALQSGGHAVGSFMGGNIAQGIQQGNKALGQTGDIVGGEAGNVMSKAGGYGQQFGQLHGMGEGLIGGGRGNNGGVYANGGPIPHDPPVDPRYTAYQDSLTSYINHDKLFNYVDNRLANTKTSKEATDLFNKARSKYPLNLSLATSKPAEILQTKNYDDAKYSLIDKIKFTKPTNPVDKEGNPVPPKKPSPRLKDVMMDRVGLEFTDENRNRIAKEAGITNYTKSAKENQQIMDYLNNLGKVTVTGNNPTRGGASQQQFAPPPQQPTVQPSAPVQEVDPNRQLIQGYNPGGYFSEDDIRKSDPLRYAGDRKRVEQRRISGSFAYGGYTGEMYEAEGGEVIEGGNPQVAQGGYVSPNSANAGMIEGNSHSNGGVKMSGGERIFSDQIYLDDDFINSLEL
jgi:hypothetical protein